MIPLFLPQQVRDMDQRAFGRGVDPAALMDLAAWEVARAVRDLAARRGLPRYGLRVVLVCGKGNNGADGVAAARHLLADGVAAQAILVVAEADLGEDGEREVALLRARHGVVRSVVDMAGSDEPEMLRPLLDASLADADILVDCLLGTGTAGEPRGAYATAVQALNAADAPVLACDLPTGVDAGTGAVPGVATRAAATLTLGAHKQGLWLPPAATHVGLLTLADIGVEDGVSRAVAYVLEPGDLAALAPPPEEEDDKRSRGVIVLYVGSERMAGAAVLCARAALLAGAGLVTVATPAAVAGRLTAAVPEAMTIPLPDDADGIVELVADAAADADVLAMGPGLGLAGDTQQAVRRLVMSPPGDIVLDADGINAFRDHRDQLLQAREERGDTNLVVTPHARELGRLAGVSEDQVHARRTDIAIEQAGLLRATVLAKGPRTVVATSDGRVFINPTGGPALGTGGTGDVLTGITATLLAQRPDPLSVAAAAYVHGLAGDLAAADRSARSVTAEDVIGHISAAVRTLAL